ncbi:UDP-N-acetylglucosamine transporter ROCK1 isoform X1 [Beta vulgaris subsp. vulgaris]|uniref:UDP-N-acetylglucosamine transporter ROCK1 isoform X1 n=1 Tax=Beta vulgaris subsp. vulgaris TaxID=3555 RepID=UPI0020375732|nr:UDP-N-acetylglucosamine transporter ROCK1 isoform X1 [Beta vulgaris subsp. vulgaris]
MDSIKQNASKTITAREERETSGSPKKVWFFSALLTLQYGAQPLISKRFTRREVIVTSSVLACEVAKVICAFAVLTFNGSLTKLCKDWSLLRALTFSGLPAAIYALQNSLLQISYKNLDSLTFSMLNQTKLFFTAFFGFVILRIWVLIFYRQKQSIQQIGALFLLIVAAVLLSIGEGTSKASKSRNPEEVLFYGIVPVLIASVLSGLASALCQWASQAKQHSSYLMTIEMSIFGSLCLLASLSQSPDGHAMKKHGFLYGWTPLTLVPVVANALGGILVGLVTSYAGGVRKGFVIVSALLVTALLQFIFDGKPPSPYCLVALPLVITSISIYQKYPYRVKKKEA